LSDCDEIGEGNNLGELKSYVLLQTMSTKLGEQVYVFCSDDKNARSGIVSLGGARCISVLSAFMRLHSEGVLLKEDAESYLQAYLSECRKHNQTTFRVHDTSKHMRMCRIPCEQVIEEITPGFKLPAKYVIHAVGPRWTDGNHNEPKLLYSAYKQSLILAKENGLHSIGFPLISAGIFGYPLDGAWRKAIQACNDFIQDNPEYDIRIIFAVLDDKILAAGEKTLKDIVGD